MLPHISAFLLILAIYLQLIYLYPATDVDGFCGGTLCMRQYVAVYYLMLNGHFTLVN